MKIETKKLTDICNKLKVGIAQKDIVEQSKGVTFDGEHIFTFDGNIYIFHPFETDFKCCVPADEFIKIISDIKSEKISIDLKEDKFSIIGPNIKALLNTIEINKENVINKTPNLRKLPSNFKEALITCSFSASPDVSSYLNGICIRDDKVWASDDYRISVFTMESEIDSPLLLPLSSVVSLKNFDIIKYGIEDNKVYFQDTDKSLFCSRLLQEDDYKDPSDHFDFEGERIRFPLEIKELIKKSSILAEGDFDIDKKIVVKLEDGKLSCKGSNDRGWIKASINIKSNKSIEFLINPQFFLQILDETKTSTVGEDRILFKTKHFKHLIALHQGED